MMVKVKFSDDFKRDTVAQIIERGYSDRSYIALSKSNTLPDSGTVIPVRDVFSFFRMHKERMNLLYWDSCLIFTATPTAHMEE